MGRFIWLSIEDEAVDEVDDAEGDKGPDEVGPTDGGWGKLVFIDDKDEEDVDGGEGTTFKVLSTVCGPGLFDAAASIGLLKGETPLELNGDEDAVFEGDGLRIPFPFRLDMLLIVLEIVCLAACFALSVDTKLLTSSLRFPFTSGVAISSKVLPTCSDDFGFGFDLVFSDNGLLEVVLVLFMLAVGSVDDLSVGGAVVEGEYCG